MAIELSPMAVYGKAVRAVPSIKYALAVAGVVAAAIIALNLASQDPRRAILGFVFALAGMYLLLVFASVGRVGDIVRGPVILTVWALTILFIVFLALALTAFAFGTPAALARAFGVIPVDARVASATAVPPAPAATPVPAAPAPAPPVRIQETFRVNDSSEDCGANQTRTLEYCLASNARVTEWSGPNIESANCGSSLSNVRRLAGRDNCIAVDVSVRGCGYDNILGLRNCRGRGWIAGSVVIAGERSGN